MTKPPRTPPHSDIDGVDEDRKSIQHPDNQKGDPGAKLKRAEDESIARPERNDPRSGDDRSD